MFQLLEKITGPARPGQVDLLVTDGRVGCPSSGSGDTGVDACLACPRLMSHYVDAGGQAWVRCTPRTLA